MSNELLLWQQQLNFSLVVVQCFACIDLECVGGRLIFPLCREMKLTTICVITDYLGDELGIVQN